MPDRIPNTEWMKNWLSTCGAAPIQNPAAVMEAWFREHGCAGARCSRCYVPFTGDQATTTVCVVPDVGIFMFCQNCSDSFKAHGFLNIPNLTWLEIPLRKTT